MNNLDKMVCFRGDCLETLRGEKLARLNREMMPIPAEECVGGIDPFKRLSYRWIFSYSLAPPHGYAYPVTEIGFRTAEEARERLAEWIASETDYTLIEDRLANIL